MSKQHRIDSFQGQRTCFVVLSQMAAFAIEEQDRFIEFLRKQPVAKGYLADQKEALLADKEGFREDLISTQTFCEMGIAQLDDVLKFMGIE